MPTPTEEVIFNQPFVYFIRAGENGLVLFAGIMNNPNETL
jgi:serine protease inhibitor